jgi:hypothetical protein
LPDCARLPVTWQTLAIVPTSMMRTGAPLARVESAPEIPGIAANAAASRVLEQNQVLTATLPGSISLTPGNLST